MSKNAKRPTLDEFKQAVLSDEKSALLYEELDAEYQIYKELIAARKDAGLTQEEVASLMGTKKPNVARLEGNPGIQKPSPTINTLQRYADAVNCRLVIKLVPNPEATASKHG